MISAAMYDPSAPESANFTSPPGHVAHYLHPTILPPTKLDPILRQISRVY